MLSSKNVNLISASFRAVHKNLQQAGVQNALVFNLMIAMDL
jgi:hypothetical protein